MRFRIDVEQILPISSLSIEIELADHRLHCIVGRNGTGKTTLAKAILNLALADIFIRTSSEGAIGASSLIRYCIENDEYLFTYDDATRAISTRTPIPAHIKTLIAVELPAPHGQRFTFFRALSEADRDIRRAVVLGQYVRPDELIEFLSKIYGDRRFDNLVQIEFSRGVCCCTVQDDRRYVREDYFSSGEYFLINLFRMISSGRPLVFIDEIDTSLDATAQARLAAQLRLLCTRHQSTVIFTSHSLALMQTLEPGELLYLERTPTGGSLTPMSFNAVKSILFGFKGWDRYILTEDEELKLFLEHVIRRYCPSAFFSYRIVKIGGGHQVTDLMRRNRQDQFFGPKEHVVSVLDGDQNRKDLPQDTYCIPIPNVEQALWESYREPGFEHAFQNGELLKAKALYKEFVRSGRLSSEEIFHLLCLRHDAALSQFAQTLTGFLCRPSSLDASAD